MYSRRYDHKVLTFEPSGGLINSSLVMQDRETDSYWAIMKGESVHGALSGTELTELPVGRKMKWQRWRRKHPDTLVLSVGGREDAPDGYKTYFSSRRGFRNQEASDQRLPTKEPIFAFRVGETAYAATHREIAHGVSYATAEGNVFLYRPADAELFESTAAFLSDGEFSVRGSAWRDSASGCEFDVETRSFAGPSGTCAEPLEGFDTFWYNWSLNNPSTILLGDTETTKE